MRARRSAAAIATLVVLAAPRPAAGQDPECATGPGAAYGVTSYQCANCATEQKPGTRTVFRFFAEPVVLYLSTLFPKGAPPSIPG